MSWIVDEINSCRNHISKDNIEITRLRKLISSLEDFEGDVYSTNSNFNDVNSMKLAYVKDLEEKILHSLPNDKYSTGMKLCLSEVGEQYVGAVFDTLKERIKRQLYIYYEQVEELKRDISRLEYRIEELYETLRREEEEARRRQNER